MNAGTPKAVVFDPEHERFNLFAPGVMGDPYPAYRILRDRSPVHFNEQIGLYFISRYADVSTLGRDRTRLYGGTRSAGCSRSTPTPHYTGCW
jgi:cytochrome P450